jgi:two-component system sensor histidine kinase/response regulator
MAAAFDAARDAALILGDDGRCVEANRAACVLLGVDADRLVGRRVDEFADSGLAMSRAPTGITDGGSAFLRDAGSVRECEVLRGDGTGVRVEFIATANVAPGCHLLILRDISERVAAEEMLDLQHRQLVEAQVVGGFGHWEWDVATERVVWSDELHRLCGLEPGTVTTFAAVHELVHPDDRAKAAAVVEDARLRGEHFEHRFRVVGPDGVVRLIESRGAIARADDGTPLRMFGTAQDVTARVEVETARRHFSTILDGSDDAITALSPQGTFESWNRGAEKVYGYSAAEAIGQSIEILFPAVESDTEERHWRRVMRGERVEPFEGTRITKDGRQLVVDTTLSPILDADGEVIGVAAISRDVTAHRQSQAALAEAHAKAVAASRLKSEFMANMNHELRTPLNGVIGVSTLLLETRLDDEQREYVEALRVSGDALMAVIEDILDFSKIEAGKLDLTTEAFPVRAVVEDVSSMVAVGQPNRAVEVIACVESSVPENVYGDSTRVRQVLTNLANNAVKFTEVGEVAIHVSGLAEATGMVQLCFEVVDTGIGIPAAAQETIFESFAQGDGSTTRRYGGTGLGLAIAKQLVNMMGGEIGVSSTIGTGSRFWFTLPVPIAPSDPTPPADSALAGVRTLVVDDKVTNLGILTAQLASWGMTVDTCADGESALAALRVAAQAEHPYDLALLDFKMPGMGGGDLADAITADPAVHSTRLVLMVAARDTRSASTLTGVDGLVTKPIRQTHLHDELARVASGRLTSPSPTGAPQPKRAPSATGAQRVLVAEDNPVNQLVAVRLLEGRGYGVDVANNGREALEMHERTPYDAIFMDCQMPELDGYDTTREIRRLEGDHRHTPIIAMTASTMPGDTERCLAAGMDYYSGKPIRAAGLDYVLALALGTTTDGKLRLPSEPQEAQDSHLNRR